MFVGVSSVFTIFLMIGTGFFLTKKRWFDDNTALLFSKVVMNIGIPALALESITRQFSVEILKPSFIYVIITFTCIFTLFFIAKIIGKLLKLEKKEKAAFCLLFTFSNAIFMGIPINKTIFGEESVIFVLLFFMASNFSFWTLGIYTMSNANSSDGSKNGFFANIKRAITPGLICVVTAFILVALGIKLPPFLARSLGYFGNLCVPLSMLFLGINIAGIDFKQLKMRRSGYVILIARFLLSPLLMFTLLSTVGITGMGKSVYIIEAGLPCQAQTAIAAKYYDVEPEYASVMVSITTCISVITVPILALLLG